MMYSYPSLTLDPWWTPPMVDPIPMMDCIPMVDRIPMVNPTP